MAAQRLRTDTGANYLPGDGAQLITSREEGISVPIGNTDGLGGEAGDLSVMKSWPGWPTRFAEHAEEFERAQQAATPELGALAGVEAAGVEL